VLTVTEILTWSKKEHDKYRHSNDDESGNNERQSPVVIISSFQKRTSNQRPEYVADIRMRVPHSIDKPSPAKHTYIYTVAALNCKLTQTHNLCVALHSTDCQLLVVAAFCGNN